MTPEWWQHNSNRYACPCGRTITHTHTRWANQHGFGRRLFCECGQVIDIWYTARGGWSMRVVQMRSFTEDGEYIGKTLEDMS